MMLIFVTHFPLVLTQTWLLRLQISWFGAWQVFVQGFKDSVCFWWCSSKQNVAAPEVSHAQISSSTLLYHTVCVKLILLILFAVLHSTQESVSRFYFIRLLGGQIKWAQAEGCIREPAGVWCGSSTWVTLIGFCVSLLYSINSKSVMLAALLNGSFCFDYWLYYISETLKIIFHLVIYHVGP